MFNRHPDGFTLLRADASTHLRIRGDLIPKRTCVIINAGIHFVDSGEHDDDCFAIFIEDHETFEYISGGE